MNNVLAYVSGIWPLRYCVAATSCYNYNCQSRYETIRKQQIPDTTYVLLFIILKFPTISFHSIPESRTPSELIPPHFVREPVDSVVSEFEPHTLECQVFGNPLPLVSWFKDDACIDYSTEYAISCNNGHCALRIEEATLEHQGRYTCRAVNPVGQVACSANITVQS